ncbi:hypothetical protein H312_01075, partial [Anncaliia algerae PRA339]
DSKITRGFATVIPNKESNTIIPIICRNVVNGSIIWTEEYKSYSSLARNGIWHGTVCHKYEFVNKSNGVNTQAVESFNNELKLEIKRRKGISTELNEEFLNEWNWRWVNRENQLEKILIIIKLS